MIWYRTVMTEDWCVWCSFFAIMTNFLFVVIDMNTPCLWYLLCSMKREPHFTCVNIIHGYFNSVISCRIDQMCSSNDLPWITITSTVYVLCFTIFSKHFIEYIYSHFEFIFTGIISRRYYDIDNLALYALFFQCFPMIWWTVHEQFMPTSAP